MSDRYDDATGRPDWYVGNDREPTQYRLVEQVHRGGEGVLWKASREVGGRHGYWAVKILLSRYLQREDEETLRQSLDRWEGIWDATIDRTAVLRDIKGIVPAIRVFQGAAPHPEVDPPPGQPRGLYLVSPWVEGQDLHVWHTGQRRDLAAVADVVGQLCHLVDQLADAEQVHRDLSPRNVMVDAAGRVSLIDFAFMRSAGAPVTQFINTRGYTAPDREIDPANDRYSTGAVVYRLLTDAPPPVDNAAQAARRGLLDRGYPAELAEHVALLLADDPASRPHRLGPWAETFRALVVRRATRTAYVDVALAVDGWGRTELTAAASGYVESGRLAPSLHLTLAADGTGPSGVSAVAAARRGTGEVVLFARDEDRKGWLRCGNRWQPRSELSGLGPIRAAALGDGSVSAFLVSGTGRLATATVTLTGAVDTRGYDRWPRQVFGAATGPDGNPVVVLEAEDGQVLCGRPEDLRQVGVCGASAAAVATNQWGEIVCVALDAGQGRVALVETLGGEWDLPTWVPAPLGARDIACAGHRGGVSVAVAADVGLLVRPSAESPDWTTVYSGRTSRVVAALGAGWRVQLAAVAGHGVVFGEEAAAGQWPPGAVTEVH